MKYTVFIAIKNVTERDVKRVKEYLESVHGEVCNFVLPNPLFQKDWDADIHAYRHRKAFRMLEGADCCNGLFRKGADIIVASHDDGAVMAALTKAMMGGNQNLICYTPKDGNSNDFDEIIWDKVYIPYKSEADDFYRASLEAHDAPSISAADDIDEGNIWDD